MEVSSGQICVPRTDRVSGDIPRFYISLRFRAAVRKFEFATSNRNLELEAVINNFMIKFVFGSERRARRGFASKGPWFFLAYLGSP